MRKLAIAGFLFANAAMAHEGHGAAAAVHLHGWEYALLSVVIIGVAMAVWRKKP